MSNAKTKAQTGPSVDRLRHVLNYCPETGVFTWRIKSNRRLQIGDLAGCPDKDGRLRIKIDGVSFMASKLAWLYQTSEWPPYEIDHINCVRTDDRISNLRPATRNLNAQNVRKPRAHNKLGILGVRLRRGKFVANLKVNGRDVQVGVFATAEEAHAAYLTAKREVHPGCTL